jgi:hypothetical protein
MRPLKTRAERLLDAPASMFEIRFGRHPPVRPTSQPLINSLRSTVRYNKRPWDGTGRRGDRILMVFRLHSSVWRVSSVPAETAPRHASSQIPMSAFRIFALIGALLLIPFTARPVAIQLPFADRDMIMVGVYYYPEAWPREQWARDLATIKRHGSSSSTWPSSRGRSSNRTKADSIWTGWTPRCAWPPRRVSKACFARRHRRRRSGCRALIWRSSCRSDRANSPGDYRTFLIARAARSR